MSTRNRNRIVAFSSILLTIAVSMPFLLSTTTTARQTPTAGSDVRCQGIFAPAYYWYDLNFFPQWDELINSGANDMVVVVGLPISKGAPDPAYTWLIQESREQGIRVLAYVQTYFGQRDTQEMISEIYTLQEWYSLDGIFIDEVIPDMEDLGYYQSLVDAVRHRPDQLVVINPGGDAPKEYVEMADMIVSFEGSYGSYLEYELPEWMRDYPSERFIHLIHTSASDGMREIVELSRERHAGSVYVTDDSGANAYHLLPTYWTQLVSFVNESC